jgi:two-component system response regulator FixJ
MKDRMVMKGPVVVVDDDQSVRTSLARLFRSAHLPMVVFPSAEAFIGSGLLESAGCLVVDVRMPGMRGLELQALCLRCRPELPVIVISAFDDDDSESRSMQVGARAFFHKPFAPTDLLKAVRQALEGGPGPLEQ